MKKNKSLIFTFVVLLFLYFGMFFYKDFKNKTINPIDFKDLTQIDIEINQKTISLIYSDTWFINEYPVSKLYINNLKDLLSNVNQAYIISESSDDLSAYGLAESTHYITFYTKDKSIIKYAFNRLSDPSHDFFLKTLSSDYIYRMNASSLHYLSIQKKDWLLKEFVNYDRSLITAIEIDSAQILLKYVFDKKWSVIINNKKTNTTINSDKPIFSAFSPLKVVDAIFSSDFDLNSVYSRITLKVYQNNVYEEFIVYKLTDYRYFIQNVSDKTIFYQISAYAFNHYFE